MYNRFGELFELEMEAWCHGIENYPGEIFPALVHSVIKELGESFKTALDHGYVFDVISLAEQFSKASKYLVHEKEISFSMLAQLPNPRGIGEEAKFTIAQVIDPVEQHYGGALERLEKKWSFEAKNI